MQSPIVPSFFLYGEPPRAVNDRFLHLEDLDDRSRPSDWVIRPHAHANLNHIFYVAAGSGTMRAEARSFEFKAPDLLIVPAKVVHAFHYCPDTRGYVLTIADSYLQDLLQREPELAPLFQAAAAVPLDEGRDFEVDLRRLAKELAWQAPAHRAAVEGRLLTILVEALRSLQLARTEELPTNGPQAILVAGFRNLVEARFRDNPSLEAYAEALCVSLARLRGACVKVAKSTPTQMVQDRIMLEARRLLIYSNMTVAEVGFSLGFQDPAYFSRFFAKTAAESPRGFRRRHQGEQSSWRACRSRSTQTDFEDGTTTGRSTGVKPYEDVPNSDVESNVVDAPVKTSDAESGVVEAGGLRS